MFYSTIQILNFHQGKIWDSYIFSIQHSAKQLAIIQCLLICLEILNLMWKLPFQLNKWDFVTL